jgi:hypothetical protein
MLGTFKWPAGMDELQKMDDFSLASAKRNHLYHEHHTSKHRVTIYSLPKLGKATFTIPGVGIDVHSGYPESAVSEDARMLSQGQGGDAHLAHIQDQAQRVR